MNGSITNESTFSHSENNSHICPSFSLLIQRKRSKRKDSPINLRRDRLLLASLFFRNSSSLRSDSDSRKNLRFAHRTIQRLRFQGKKDSRCFQNGYLLECNDSSLRYYETMNCFTPHMKYPVLHRTKSFSEKNLDEVNP